MKKWIPRYFTLNVIQIVIFNYLADKDVFQKYYSRFLAKRLIFNTSISSDAESSMIQKLSVSCGVEYTSKLARMFTDMATSAELSTNFRKSHSLQVYFNIALLTSGSWPLTISATNTDFFLPSEFDLACKSFTRFYLNQHSGRRLTWLHQYSKLDLKSSCFDRPYEFNASLYQACILLLFNDSSALSIDFIIQQTGLDKLEVERVCKV